MLFATAGQGALFVWMLASGVVIGIWYLLTACLRHILQAGFWLTLICDLAFGSGCAAIWMAFLVAGNYGRVRLFTVIAPVLGALAFACAAAPAVNTLERAMRKVCRRIVTALSGNRLIKVIFR